MYKFKLKELDPYYPPVHGCARLDIQGIKHAFDVTGINFHPYIPDTNDVESVGLKGVPKTINLNLGLGITQLPIVPSDRAKMAGVSLAVGS